jgi:uncharacterized protein (DUF736 family)
MAYIVENENTGSIFKNDHKEKEQQPDYKGNVNVAGIQYDVALWVKDGKNGRKYMSAKFSEPYVRPEEIDETIGIERERSFAPVGNDDPLPF